MTVRNNLFSLSTMVSILFMPESTEGVSEGQTTAMSGENN